MLAAGGVALDRLLPPGRLVAAADRGDAARALPGAGRVVAGASRQREFGMDEDVTRRELPFGVGQELDIPVGGDAPRHAARPADPFPILAVDRLMVQLVERFARRANGFLAQQRHDRFNPRKFVGMQVDDEPAGRQGRIPQWLQVRAHVVEDRVDDVGRGTPGGTGGPRAPSPIAYTESGVRKLTSSAGLSKVFDGDDNLAGPDETELAAGDRFDGCGIAAQPPRLRTEGRVLALQLGQILLRSRVGLARAACRSALARRTPRSPAARRRQRARRATRTGGRAAAAPQEGHRKHRIVTEPCRCTARYEKPIASPTPTLIGIRLSRS